MCGIGGFFNPGADFTKQPSYYNRILDSMNQVQKHRGPDAQGILLEQHGGLAHDRLSIIDLSSGAQPMSRKVNNRLCSIVYNGELYNTKELYDDLLLCGWDFRTKSDTEVILLSYLEYGAEFVDRLNGIFSFAILDTQRDCISLYRDRSGVKPLFYTFAEDTLVFSSEIKGLFSYPGVKPVLDLNGLNEIFSIGPAKTYGCGVFKNVHEVLPGHFLRYDKNQKRDFCYWKLEGREHEDDYKTTVEKTRDLVVDSIKRQMISDVPICTFLSGGIDSSLVSAVCAMELAKQGKQLHTFSFDFTDNDKYFQASGFQPSQDRPYVDKMVSFLDSKHQYLECSIENQTDLLTTSVDAHDLPSMADVDSSMLYFCSQVSSFHKVTLTGECADEIFGGYPWFHKKECFDAHTFPWTMDLSTRKALLSDEFLHDLKMDEYISKTYEKSIAETPRLYTDSPNEKRRREISYLNLKWFMQTLLDRMDRTSMYSGLEARVPFADHRIIEYLFNVPWDMKTRNGVVKGLLRESARNLLPDDILFRKKSPYPKTYDTHYESLLQEKIQSILSDSSSPVLHFLDAKKVEHFLQSPSDYGKPWYGQLMAGPQLLAYLYQINYWLKKYNIETEW